MTDKTLTFDEEVRLTRRQVASGAAAVGVFIAGIISTLVIPGYIMRNDVRKEDTANTVR